MNNATIADTFESVADLLEFQGANAFRVRAYRAAAHAIRDLPESLATLIEKPGFELTQVKGIGKDLAAKCQELVTTGRLAMLEELQAATPESVLQFLRIPGLGPKKAATIFRELHIATLSELENACREGRIRQLSGFGAKTEEAILRGLSFAAQATQRLRWADADALVQELLADLRQCGGVDRLEAAGSYRRGKETVGDIDLLAVADAPDAVMDRLAAFPAVESVLARGDTKLSVRIRPGIQVDLRVVPAASFGAAWQYFTGSKEHNVELRGRAKESGLKINEYGVYRLVGDEEQLVAGATEEEVYAAVQLPWIPPELREARQEYAWAASSRLPPLIRTEDLQGDLHMHTRATDGNATIEEMVAAAQERGLSYIAITDHSKRVSMANGLDATRLLAQWRLIDRIQRSLGDGFHIFKGIECDILEQGGMDLPDEVLAQGDWVIASVHYGQQQSRAQITDRIVGALANPYVTIVAHPTGRLINRRAAYEVDLEAVFQAAAEHGKLLELNANPYRLDLDDVHCAMAKTRGIPIAINSDAHSCDGIDVLRYGILQARRGGLTAGDVLNTRSLADFRAWLAARRDH